MAGEYVPLVMIPRFTSYLGPGVYTTVALDVSAFSSFHLTFWRGELVGAPADGAGFSLTFESSDTADPDEWLVIGTSIVDDTTVAANAHLLVDGPLTQRYVRAKLTITEDTVRHVVAMTCWAAGSLVRREAA